ncbi:MAG: hypothetical protein ABI165_12275 [Bryobacteraceae bacterium]
MEQHIFSEMFWGFSAAWLLLIATAIALNARGRRLERRLRDVQRGARGGA